MEDEAGVVELVDTQDLKSCALLSVRVQVPPLVQKALTCRGFLFFYPTHNESLDGDRRIILH